MCRNSCSINSGACSIAPKAMIIIPGYSRAISMSSMIIMSGEVNTYEGPIVAIVEKKNIKKMAHE